MNIYIVPITHSFFKKIGTTVRDKMIKEMKINLYHEILLVAPDKLSDIEIELGCLLAQDKDIQDHLNKINKNAELLYERSKNL